MKIVKVSARLSEKQDILESFDSLTNEEIKRFVCDFEGLQDIKEWDTKTIHTKRLGDVLQLQIARADDSWDEFYSGKTCTVYRVSYDASGKKLFEKIYFKENRPTGIKYGLDVDTGEATAYCVKHSMVISTHPNWLGHQISECSKCHNEKLELRKEKENYPN